MARILTSSNRKHDDQLSVSLEAHEEDQDEPRIVVRLHDPMGNLLATSSASYSDLVRLFIAVNTECQIGEILVEASEGWDGYWFRMTDGQSVHVEARDFRAALDEIENDLAALAARSRADRPT